MFVIKLSFFVPCCRAEGEPEWERTCSTHEDKSDQIIREEQTQSPWTPPTLNKVIVSNTYVEMHEVTVHPSLVSA